MWASANIASKSAIFALASITFLSTPSFVAGHGFLESPRSRNFLAHEDGPICSGAGCPPAEYCHHCLNLNDGVCGKFGGRSFDGGSWLDKTGGEMPWASEGVYFEGDEIIVRSYLDTHHNGHMEIRACNKGNACGVADFEAEGSALIFVRDNVLEGPAGTPAMPPDENYPERGMYAGGQGGGIKFFEFVFRLPEGMYGDEVLLQWLYITANSCSPPGYAEYFAAHPELPPSYWTPGVSTCTPPYPNDGTRGTTWPERFYNCAEISVSQSGTSSPTVSPKPTPAPTTSSPTDSLNPTLPPVSTPSCLLEWADCTYDWSGCCDGLKCTQVNEAGWGTCLVDTCTDEDPTPPPTNAPTPPVTNAPTPPPIVPVPTNPPTSNPTNAPSPPSPTPNPTSNPTNQPTPVPPPTTSSPIGSAFPAVESDKVRVNQVGYLRYASKIGVIVDSSTSPLEWQVQDSVGSVILAGDSDPFGFDDASGDDVHQVDFSDLTDLGTYKLVVNGIGASLEFAIAPSLYADLPHEAMNYFYFHRMGPDEILGEHLIDERYARDALHPADGAVPPYPGWCEGCDDFDLLGSWADAGDFGVYTVNHAISAWTLLNLHELFPEAFVDGTLNIPESGNSIPDVLDEVNYGSRFVRGMLPSDGGLASHKAHNHAWSAFTITVEAENQNNAGTRSAMGSSTPATYAVARVNAQLARMYASAPGDNQAHVSILWDAAVDAWGRADGTSKTYNAGEASPGPALGGGDYPDGAISDDRYAAACEMYLTAYALGDSTVQSYKSAMTQSSHFKAMGQWDWATVAAAGTLSLYAVSNDLSSAEKTSIEANIISFADQIKASIDAEGYPSNLAFPSEYSKYPWGSNSFIMNRMIALAYAFEITSDVSYQKYILRSMDYIMGTNAMDISYVTGYGEKAETDTHDRWAWTIGQDTFWPKGWLSGGPNNELINDYETPGGVAAAKSYAAPGTAPHAWGSKENTINWNAPLAWVAWYIENKAVPVLGGCDGNCPPTVQSLSNIKVQMDSSVSLTLSASDYDGTIVSWEVTSPSFGVLTGDAPNLVYTPNTGALGTDTFTFRAIDDSGDASNFASVTITVRDCNLIDVFSVPSTYAAFQGSYNYVHVSEDGPSLSNLKTPAHNVQWQDPGLYQFSLELEVEPYYADLKQCMTVENLSGADASFTLSGCSVNGIDGEYWVTQQDGNEIWVEKNNLWALVFTNDANYTPQFCRGDGTASPTPQVTPNPTQPPVNTPPPTPPTSTPPPTPPTGGNTATTTRYWDCSGGSCGCSFVPTGLGDNQPVHCHSNAMFAAPSGNPFGATYYGAAAISEALGGGNWMSSGCGKCWKVTGYSPITASSTTLVLKGTNYCPPSNAACAGNNVHFDIAAPGFDVTEFSQSNTCSEREPEEATGFASCGRWMIDSQNPNENCNCDAFNDPVLKAGCNNFYNLKWDNPDVAYEEVNCPDELAQLHCGHPYATENNMPETCSNNLFTASPPTFPPTNVPSSQPTPEPTTLSPTAPPTDAPSPNPTPGATTLSPTAPPTNAPTKLITSAPTNPAPTSNPTPNPTSPPSKDPTSQPTSKPTTAPPSNAPTPPPTNAATLNPTSPPTSGGTFCCGDRNTGYQQCNNSNWCNQSTNNCNMCGGFMTTVPIQRTGCCSWWGDCSSQDPTSNPGCHYLQSDCEGGCGGTWQAF